MTIKTTTLLFLLLSATLALSQHPEKLQQCKDQCEKVYGGQELEFQCKRICEEQQIKPEPARRGDDPWEKEQLRSCKDKCDHLGRPRKEHCEQDCEHKYKRGDGNSLGEGDHQNPYFFGRERFKDWMRSQQGKIQILERFDERSELLAGIANYRVKILEAEPQTLVIPKHTDVDDLFYVANGEGVINLLREDRRESHELRRGHIFRVPAGTIVYIINTHNQQKLCLVHLLQPVSTPGEFETFFDAGGENPETYFRSFSDEVKEAAFNAPKERIDRVFSNQNKGVIIKVSREQIEQLSRKSSSEGGRVWPFGGGESQQGPFDLLGKRPSHKNSRGEHYEAHESDYKQLRDLDIQISYANITGGSMISPYYLSRSTEVSVIISGKGYVEIVCPHLASEKSKRWEKEQQRGQQEQGQEQEEQGKEQKRREQGSEQGKEQKRREQEQGREQGKEQKREQKQGQGKEQKRPEQEQEQEQGQQGKEQKRPEQEQEQEQGQQGKEQKRREQEQEQEQGQQGKEQKRREQEQEQEQGQQGKEQKREQEQEQKQAQHGKEQKRGEQEQQQGPRYQRIRSNVSPGTVVVTPAGHPSVWVASKGENLEVLSFEINARNNQRYSLAGEDNILKKLEDVAKEVAYGTSAKEVNALFDAQDEKMFVAGPEERKEGRGGKRPLESIMDFAGF